MHRQESFACWQEGGKRSEITAADNYQLLNRCCGTNQREMKTALPMNNLFAYGTLQCREVMIKVTGRLFPFLPGELYEYRCRSIHGVFFPGMIPAQGAVVHGLVYFDISEQAWQLLDLFEGEMYERTPVNVILPCRTSVQADTYLVRPEYYGLLEKTDWHLGDFIRNAKKQFLQDLESIEQS